VSHIHLIAHAILNFRSSLCWCLFFWCNLQSNRKTDQKFPVQIESGTEFNLNLVEILSGRILIIFGLAPVQFSVLTGNSRSKPGLGPSSNREWSKTSLAGFSPFPVWVRSDSRSRPEISGSNRILDRVRTGPARNRLWRVFGGFRFQSSPDPGLVRKFPVWFPVGPEIKPKKSSL
jgi:hypothetical protein